MIHGRIGRAILGATATFACLLSGGAGCGAAGGSPGPVRDPAVAGRFYPDDPAKLRAAVEAFLADAVPARGETPAALVAPHAGYIFSGQIAADAWKQVQGAPIDLVVILGTNHTVEPFEGVSVFQGAGYRTPLGVAPVDGEVAKALLEADASCTYRPEAHIKEHSEEVQVPFAQVLFPGAKIVTAVLGKPDAGPAERFGEALAGILKGRRALVVASSDLSHYPTYGDAVAVDSRTLRAVASMDATAVASALDRCAGEGRPNLGTGACGEGPVLAAIAYAKALGAKRGVVLSYANSGDTVLGEYDRVVGYGAVAFLPGEGKPDARALDRPKPGKGGGDLGPEDRAALITLARRTLERYFATGTVPLPRPASPALLREQGCFVTLKAHGDLRGCMGRMSEDTPLALCVAKMAMEAAFGDRRFEALRPDELAGVHIDISVLTPLQRASGPEAVVLGRDGVVISKGGRRAVFLPQVALEQGWTKEEMFGHLCQKAGMPSDCWKAGCEFQTFSAIVFEEKR